MSAALTRRALNRATLARQHLLTRAELSVPQLVEHLVGLQAQTPHSWYVGLWSRLAGFRPGDAADLLDDRTLVRVALMRSTLHLVTARDARRLRPLVQPALDRDLYSNATHGHAIRGVDIAELVTLAQRLLHDQPLTNQQLGAQLHGRWPEHPASTLVYAVRNQLPLVQVPPRGLWGRSGPIAHTSIDSWLGPPTDDPRPSVDQLVLRYLAAFGPATVADLQTWSGLTRLREIVERLAPQLLSLGSVDGRDVYDLPDAPRPGPDVSAAPRFLYDFDNLLLSHADRSRVITADYRRYTHRPHGPAPQAVLVDGFTAAEWTLTHTPDTTTLTVTAHEQFDDDTAVAIVAEGHQLLTFLTGDTRAHQVVIHTRGRPDRRSRQ